MAAESIAADDPTGWFERVYAAAAAGQTAVPWDRGTPSRYLTQWAAARDLCGAGQGAVGYQEPLAHLPRRQSARLTRR